MAGSSNGSSKTALPKVAADPSPGRRFWVSGATGFLGSHVTRLLSTSGHDVVAVSRRGGRAFEADVQALDLLDSSAVADSARGCDGAFIASGLVSRRPEDAELLHRQNVMATKSALAGLRAAGVKRVVYASTSGIIAVGRDPESIHTEASEPPLELITRWPYYRSKLYGEREALEASSSDFEVVIVCPSLLLGPGDLRDSSTGDVRSFLDGSIPAVPAGGIAFVDVRDAARGMVAAFERGRAGERYLLNGKNLTIAAFFQRLSRLTGIPAPRLRLPASPALATFTSRAFAKAIRALGGEPPVDEASVELGQYFWYCSSAKAERELGFTARDAGETLRDTVDDLLERRVVSPKGALRRPIVHPQ